MQSSPVTQTVTGRIGDFLSHSKLSNFLACLIIFFSATQLGLHFWPLSSLVYGIRIDYLSPTIYFLDLLIIVYLAIQPKKQMITLAKSPLITIGLPVLLTNLLFTSNPLSTLSWSLHFLLYLSFVSSLLPRLDLKSIITFSLLFQLILILFQVVLGHSVGGLLYYLGERNVAVGQPAVALGTFMNSIVLRGYGTFSHPNVLAGWSVISLLLLLRLKSNNYLLVSAAALTTAIVVLTQSRSALLALFGLIIPFYIFKNFKTRLIYFSIFLLSLLFVLKSNVFSRPIDLSFSQRRILQNLSLSIIRTFPVFGSGAQASIAIYPSIAPGNRLLQPDHNSFTLFFSWFGIFGVFAIIYYLRIYSKFRVKIFEFTLPLLPLLLLDHYLLTSPQGLFILLLYLRVTMSHQP